MTKFSDGQPVDIEGRGPGVVLGFIDIVDLIDDRTKQTTGVSERYRVRTDYGLELDAYDRFLTAC